MDLCKTLAAALANGGATINPQTHRARTTGYAVSPYKARERKSQTLQITKVCAFLVDNADLLNQPGHYLGLWFDSQSSQWFYDVTIVTATSEEAERIARESQQLAYFWLDECRELRVAPTWATEPACK